MVRCSVHRVCITPSKTTNRRRAGAGPTRARRVATSSESRHVPHKNRAGITAKTIKIPRSLSLRLPHTGRRRSQLAPHTHRGAPAARGAPTRHSAEHSTTPIRQPALSRSPAHEPLVGRRCLPSSTAPRILTVYTTSTQSTARKRADTFARVRSRSSELQQATAVVC